MEVDMRELKEGEEIYTTGAYLKVEDGKLIVGGLEEGFYKDGEQIDLTYQNGKWYEINE